MYGARCDNVICGLIDGATLAIWLESESSFVHGRVKTPDASSKAIELNPRYFGQAHSKGPRIGLGKKTWSTDVRLE